MKRARRAALAAAATLTVGLATRHAAAQHQCAAPKTTCAGHSGYYASSDDVDRLTAVADPILRDVRACLDKNGAKHVASVLVIRWDSDGKPVDVRIDAPGYESLQCVKSAQSKLSALENPHETAIRCEFGCASSQPQAKPAPAPVVVPPPAPAQPAQPSPPAQPSQAQPEPKEAPPPAPRPEQPRETKVWYGYQTLVADGVSFALFVGGLAGQSGGLVATGYVGFVTGTPVVHMVHGNIGKGFGSIGIRLLMPLVGLGVGALAGLIAGGTSGSGSLGRVGDGANGAATGAVIGGFLGAAGCVAIDALGFAYEKQRVDDGATSLVPRPTSAGRLTLAPTFGVQRGSTTLGVVGQF